VDSIYDGLLPAIPKAGEVVAVEPRGMFVREKVSYGIDFQLTGRHWS
jgi:hypothetical protein